MTKEELNYIKDAFSQIIDDIAGNPDWNEAARAVASDLGTLERELEKKVACLPSSLDEAADEYVQTLAERADENLRIDTTLETAFKAGAEWLAGQGVSMQITDDTEWADVDSFIHKKVDGDSIIQIRKKQ